MDRIVIGENEFNGVHVATANSNILLIQGSKGFLGCGYFKVEIADKMGDAAAIVTGVKNYQDMEAAKVVAVSAKARELGVNEGITGKEALALLA